MGVRHKTRVAEMERAIANPRSRRSLYEQAKHSRAWIAEFEYYKTECGDKTAFRYLWTVLNPANVQSRAHRRKS